MSFIKIGIDFDNTLICYDNLFYQNAFSLGWIPQTLEKSKKIVKKYIVELDGNDLRWQKLQVLTYGERILLAPYFDGVLDFFNRISAFKVEFYLISHKTSSTNIDPEINLRDYALQWMESNDLFTFINRKNVFFCETRDEKINKINEIGCHFFIDDLVEVLEHSQLNRECFKILFSDHHDHFYSGTDWHELTRFIEETCLLGFNEFSFIKHFTNSKLVDLSAIRRSGNNRIFKFKTKDKSEYILKTYMNTGDKNFRNGKEFKALELLNQHKVSNVPRPLLKDENLCAAIYTHLPGEVPQNWNSQIESSLLKHLTELDHVFVQSSNDTKEWAIDSRTQFSDYQDIIEKRLTNIINGVDQDNVFKPLRSLIFEEIVPFKDILICNFESDLDRFNFEKDKKFTNNELTFSPSDYGLHNMLLSNEQISFIDFEYFGMDDSAKMLADFYYHVGFKATRKERKVLIDKYISFKVRDNNLKNRFEVVSKMIHFEWILIVLNICSPGVLERRLFSNPLLSLNELINERLENANHLFNELKCIC